MFDVHFCTVQFTSSLCEIIESSGICGHSQCAFYTYVISIRSRNDLNKPLYANYK